MGNKAAGHDTGARLLVSAGNAAALRTVDEGEQLLRQAWAHVGASRSARSTSDTEKLRVFRDDGFRCRYTGDLLLLPAYLRALSALWPETVPYHPNWKSEETHEAYWSHTASLEHINPISIGGAEAGGNWITTSMARNQLRSRFSLEALGWQVQPRSPLSDWDGGVGALLSLLKAHPNLLEGPHGTYLKKWRTLIDRDVKD
ncbi:hypothetical protein [Hyphomicrobium sulfonivorans]|uniref:hypothetical protein n=1 Tax=Hyphomicrobium sulfonivorans TaxID=121290 RepID=UPI00156F85BD|nr:hypothetical protein [Hyphomicrobium sulfonivorans]MBI1651175.1 hypothetical protein [Hyphomicrobium sulfonivorans]